MNLLAEFSTSFSILLAQANWKRLGDRFSGREAQLDTGDVLSILGVFAGAGLLLWLLHWAANRQEHGATRPNPQRLFRDLCRTHGVRRADRATLKTLAEAAGLEQPAELFLRPDLFEPENLPAVVKGAAKSIALVGQSLFSDLREAADSNDAAPVETEREATHAEV